LGHFSIGTDVCLFQVIFFALVNCNICDLLKACVSVVVDIREPHCMHEVVIFGARNAIRNAIIEFFCVVKCTYFTGVQRLTVNCMATSVHIQTAGLSAVTV